MPVLDIKLFAVCRDGKEVFRGTMQEVCQKFGVSSSSVYDCSRNKKVTRTGYRIDHVGYQKLTFSKEPKEPKPIKKDASIENNPLEFLKWHLKVYGNTSVQFDPVPYLPDLSDLGLNCRVKEIPDYVETSRVTKRGRKPKQRYHYLVEVVHADRGRQSVQK